MGRWLGERRNRTLALMQSIEAKTSAFLADCANLTVSQCLQRFNSSLNGLNDDQISTSTAEYGPNVLSSAKPPRWWTLLFGCALNPFNLLLTILAVISIATAQRATFVILMVMVLLSIGLRFWQELKNSIAVTELTKLVNDTVHVVRNGMQVQLSKTGLLPGDIVRLSGGDVVPADVLLVSTSGLYVSQSMLTGENLPVLKQITDGATLPQSILDSLNICFSGSTIASGSATALVVATGDSNSTVYHQF
jgi:Mg2+-importing ATPase